METVTSETRPDVTESSVGDLVRELTNDVSRLMRQEVALARAEVQEDIGRGSRAVGLLGGAGVAGWLALLFVSLAVMFALSTAMDVGWAALIVGAVWAIVGAVLYARGKTAMKTVTGPRKTIETMKEMKEDMR